MIIGRQLVENLAMSDTCRLGYRASPSGKEPAPGAWTWTSTDVACGVRFARNKEVFDGSQVTVADGEIILPLGTQITEDSARDLTAEDGIKVTARHGRTVSETYSILGEPVKDAACIVCNVRRITAGSAL